MREDNGACFAGFERGEICGKKAGPLYKVKSYTRGGIISRWMQAIPQANDAEFEMGDRAYFFMFDDGRGMVIGPMID